MERVVEAELSYAEDRVAFLSECPTCGDDVVVIADEEPTRCKCSGRQWTIQPMVLYTDEMDAVGDYYAVGVHHLSEADLNSFDSVVAQHIRFNKNFVPAKFFDETWPGRRASMMELADQRGYSVFTGLGDAVNLQTGCPDSMGFRIHKD